MGKIGSYPMTPGVPMSPIDLIRNFVIDHYQDEVSMRRAHEHFWSPLEAKYSGNTAALEEGLKCFLDGQGLVVEKRWDLFKAFNQWFSVGAPGGSEGVAPHASNKMVELLVGLSILFEL